MGDPRLRPDNQQVDIVPTSDPLQANINALREIGDEAGARDLEAAMRLRDRTRRTRDAFLSRHGMPIPKDDDDELPY